MEIVKNNLFRLDQPLPNPWEPEIFDVILKSENIKIQRIISNGNTGPKDGWYDQDFDELVFLMKGQAVLEFEDRPLIRLFEGDYLFIPAHVLHRVKQTSTIPHCVWLAIYFKNFNFTL